MDRRTQEIRVKSYANLALLGACVFVAAGSVATKPALDAAPALPVLFMQILAGAIPLTLIAAVTSRLPNRRQHLWLAIPGVLHPGLSFILLTLGLALLSASLYGLLVASEAALVALLAWPLLKERPSVRIALAIVVGTIGVALLTNGGLANTDGVSVAGVALVLGGVLCMALDTITVRALLAGTRSDALTLTVAADWASLLPIGAAMTVSGQGADWSWIKDTRVLSLVVISGAVIHCISALLFNYALAHIEAARAAAMFPLISVLIAAGGIAFLDETLSGLQFLGGAVIIASAVIVALDRERGSPAGKPANPQAAE